MSAQHKRGPKSSGRTAAGHVRRSSDEGKVTPAFHAGVNPLYGSNISARSASSQVMNPDQENGGGHPPTNKITSSSQAVSTKSSATGNPARRTRSTSVKHSRRPKPAQHSAANGGGHGAVSGSRSNPHSGSPHSVMTTSTMQSSTSSRAGKRPGSAAVAQGNRKGGNRVSGGGGGVSRKVTKKAANGRPEESVGGPAPLVPALLAPVPPPPPKRRVKKGDVETGGASEASVLEDAPDKTIMEMVQAYLKKQDMSTRVTLIALLLMLCVGVFGVYVLIFYKAVQDKNAKYIVLCVAFSLIIGWVTWKYCFSGDEKLQDQSAIAQDIATLYAAIPDHTALRGVSVRGRAQFTDFKYEKSEMMFTAVTDDGVSLGSERGSELMMEGADPACPLCNVAYMEGAELCLLPCLHVFHKNCIHKWCNKHIVCPLCKRHLEAPEPIHNLTAATGYPATGAQSEPGRHPRGASGRNGTWRNMLGASQPGPASGHGSERGLGGTRSEDGLWNDRVLNAAQHQQLGRGHNRVTSFSSETRRQTGRGRSGTPSRGPPQSGSSGSRAAPAAAGTTGGGGPGGGGGSKVRSKSVGGHGGHSRSERGHGRGAGPGSGYQRQRSSSFTTASERGRGGSGRVAHGTRAERGGATLRFGDTGSPRSRSDLGVGSSDSRGHSDAQLSRHAMRHAGAGIKPIKKMFAEDGTGGNWASNGSVSEAGSDVDVVQRRRTAESTASSKSSSRRGAPSQGQRSAVITVRKVKDASARQAGSAGRGRTSTRRDVFRSGGSDTDASKQEVSRTGDDDSSPEQKTKALTYGPRKPRVSSSKRRSNSVGHRRISSTGSTSAEESSASVRKPRRRIVPVSAEGEKGNNSTAVATAEAAANFLNRTTKSKEKGWKVGVRSASEGRNAAESSQEEGTRRSLEGAYGHSSGGEGGDSSSDNRPRSIVRRRLSSKKGATSARTPSAMATSAAGAGTTAQRRHTHPIPKQTPPKPGPTTKGTPAPPMAPARVASWNVVGSGLPPPPPSASVPTASSELNEADPYQSKDSSGQDREEGPTIAQPQPHQQNGSSLPADKSSSPVDKSSQGGRDSQAQTETLSTSAQEESSNSMSPQRNSSGGSRGWSLRIPSTESSEYFVGGITIDGDTTGAGGGGPDGEQSGTAVVGGGPGISLASKVFSPPSGSRFSLGGFGSGFASGRLFGSSGVGKAGVGKSSVSMVSDSDEERHGHGSSEGGVRKSISVQELIRTYEKPRLPCDDRDDKYASDVGPSTLAFTSSSSSLLAPASNRNSGNFRSLRKSSSDTESDENGVVNCPKLSYKKKPKTDSRPGSGETTTTKDGEEVPEVNPDGEEWGNEDPYIRPKLSYGSGLSRTGSFT